MRAERKNKEADRAREHDFEVIDSAVSGTATVEPEDAALASFALAVKAARPELGAGFELELNERIHKARTVGDTAGAGVPAWRRRRPQLVASGLALAVLGASVLISGSIRNQDELAPESAITQASGPEPAQTQKAAIAETLNSEPSADALSAGPRDVVRDARVRIGTGADQFTETTDEIIAITDRLGGYVMNSSIGDGTESPSDARISLMVPEGRFQEALAEISKLGTVLSRTQSMEDVTVSVSRVERRVARARAQRAALVRRLNAAATDQQRAAIRAQLRQANSRLRVARNAQREAQRSVAYSSIAATVTPSKAGDSSSAVGSAWNTAKSVLEMIVAGMIVVLAIGLPIGLLALAVAAAARLRRRRLRDHAIDSAEVGPSQAT